jgi:hypothetical protein
MSNSEILQGMNPEAFEVFMSCLEANDSESVRITDNLVEENARLHDEIRKLGNYCKDLEDELWTIKTLSSFLCS